MKTVNGLKVYSYKEIYRKHIGKFKKTGLSTLTTINKPRLNSKTFIIIFKENYFNPNNI